MSYLNRLIRRTQGADQPQSLQPFVRSTSPIAEQDQRLGMANFDNSVFPVTEVGTGQDWREIEEGKETVTPEITPSREVTVQRKLASPETNSLPSVYPSPGTRPGLKDKPLVGVKTEGNRSLAFRQEGLGEPSTPSNHQAQDSVQGDTPPPSSPVTKEVSTQESEPVHSQPAVVRSQKLSQHLEGSESFAIASSKVTNVTQTTVDRERTNPRADANVPTAVPANPLVNLPNLEPLENQEVEQQRISSHGIHPRTVVPDFRNDIPQLEPSRRYLTNPNELPFEEATPLPRWRQESPQVVIGRVNVEVVSPPASEGTAKPRSEPLTAASMSVIGSLGRGVSSNVRLSLRQR